MSFPELAVLHAAVTSFLCGLCWFVQVVHYPLFRAVGSTEFVAYEREHRRRVSFVVVPAMLVEAGAAVWLWATAAPPVAAAARAGLVLLTVVWVSTFGCRCRVTLACRR